ncbi:MAG: magnesium transporter [Planctomycetota bacterium]|nr:MAG: magnesium transporter [Planctomycetota bacterium]
MVNTLYLPELREMLAENDSAELREFCTALHAARTAEFMEGLTPTEAWEVLKHADRETRAEIFGYFDRDKQVEIIETGDRTEMGQLIANLPNDDRVDVLNHVEPEIVVELLPFVPEIDRRDILRLSSYAEGTAGAVMTTALAKIGEERTVREALEEIGRQAEQLETIYYVYVVDNDDHLRGLVSARQLVSAMGKPHTKIKDLMERDLVTVRVDDDQEKVAQDVARFDLHAIPVVDEEHRLIGIITHDDMIDVMREEASEDVYRMAAVQPLVENYLETALHSIWWKRSIWLSWLFLAEMLTLSVMVRFESSIKEIVALTFFVPLCIATGGMSGTQAATLITRAMALGHVALSDWWRVILHELAVGVALGVTLGAMGFVGALLTPDSDSLGGANPYMFALVISQAVMAICVWGTMVGSMLPLAFARFGIDPAYASSPFVATFVDVTGILILFTLAQVYLF